MAKKQSTVVVGAGWSGLTAAVTLAKQNHHVRLFEASPQCGGRARRVLLDDLRLDNGQHLLMGSYEHTGEILSLVDPNFKENFFIDRMSVHTYDEKWHINLQIADGIFPIFLLRALYHSTGLSISLKIKLMKIISLLMKAPPVDDTPLSDWLMTHGCPKKLLTQFFAPIAVAALTTPIERASTHVFSNILRICFQSSADSQYWIPKTDLSHLFVEPCLSYLKDKEALISTGTRIDEICIESNELKGICSKGAFIPCQRLILALPPAAMSRLIKPHDALSSIHECFQQYVPAPIATLYLRYPEQHRLPYPIFALTGQWTGWVFDRAVLGQPGVFSLVFSGEEECAYVKNSTNRQAIYQYLKRIVPSLPNEPLSTHLITEKMGAFEASTGIQNKRPAAMTPIHGLFLAGDYVSNPFPATLEGAVFNGQIAAQMAAEHAVASQLQAVV